jgi:CRP-like cAMP-binding protein
MSTNSPAAAPVTVACDRCPLRGLPIFDQLASELIAFIQARKVGDMVVRARGSITREGDRSERVSTLLSGWAFRYRTLPDGRRQILNILLPGDLIGLQAKLFGEAPHGVEAITDVHLCLFARERMHEFFSAQPQLAYDVTWLSAREEMMVDASLLSVGRRSAAESMASFVLHLFRRAQALGMGDETAMPMPLTQAHLADALGLSAVHANRTLRLMRARKLFDLASGMLRRVDVAGLARLSGSPEPDFSPRPLI